MKITVLGVVLAMCASAANAAITLAERGRATAVIVSQEGAAAAEQLAARELREHLSEITGALFDVRSSAEAGETAVIVGPGPMAARLFPDVDLNSFGPEQLIMRVSGNKMLLAGGRPRGTLYAVSRFLQTQLGVRWWAPWATTVPRRKSIRIADLDVTEQPAFESRDPFWFPAFDAMWAVRNRSNSQSSHITPEMGGKIIYTGFVHTFFPLVPPSEHFAQHPEWYSLINGKRQYEGAQLCTTNPELRDFLVQQVRSWLKNAPDARIISISQNDWAGPCTCPACKEIDDREGSHAGTMVTLLNYIADKLGPEFPDVAFDTLAYQYTRKAPRTIRPRPNVIIRLCSIECNFAAPLTDPSNASFAQDIVDWNRICNRLYIWDYTTNFAHYVMPHPNYFSLGPNVRFFKEHGVRGLFEQGAYQSYSSEMSELRAWVLAQLLWDPNLDDRKLIDEFLIGYYGKKAAAPLGRYLALMSSAANGFYMGCFTSPSAPYLNYKTLVAAEALLQKAEDAAAGDPDAVWRVRQARLPVWYAWLVRWSLLRRECLLSGGPWPVPASRKALADQWLTVATGSGPSGWSRMTHVNESGLTPERFVARFAEDPADPEVHKLPRRASRPAPPAGLARTGAVDIQDSYAQLANEGEWAEYRGDPLSSDGLAAYMPSTHHEWAVQFHILNAPKKAQTGTWKVYALVRVDPKAASPRGTAFTAGVWDNGMHASQGSIEIAAADAGKGYRPYLLGTVESRAERVIWIAPAANPALNGIWVDRVWLVPAD